MMYLLVPIVLMVASAAVECARADEGVFDSNGVRIRYVSEGEGEAVVLIHGWMADSSMWGRDAAGKTKLKATTAGYRVIALDCRGHGESDKPHEVERYGAEMGEDVARLLDHLKIEQAHLVGYSSGAYLAGYMAAKHPGRVLSVVYAGQAPLLKAEETTGAGADGGGSGTPGGGEEATAGDGVKKGDASERSGAPKRGEGAKPAGGAKGHDAATDEKNPGGASSSGGSSGSKEEASEVEIFARAVDEGRDLGAYIMAVTPAGQKGELSAENAKTIANYMFKGKDVKALAAAGRGFKQLGVTVAELRTCEAPALFIHGGNESEAVKSHVAAVRTRLGAGGGGALRIIEGGDHMTTLTKPEFGAAVEEFLKGVKGK